MEDVQVTVVNTDGFKALEVDSRGRNRGPNEELLKKLDPSGLHVVSFQMVHNDEEYRTDWAVKLLGSDQPVHVFMDNSFEAYDKHSYRVTCPIKDYWFKSPKKESANE